MSYYPVALDLRGRRCVVVGGGPLAEQKVLGLLGAGPAGTWQEQLAWGTSLTGATFGKAAILFPKPEKPA